jgi:hypothetical protein
MVWHHIPHGLVELRAVMFCQNERVHEKLSYYERGSGTGAV